MLGSQQSSPLIWVCDLIESWEGMRCGYRRAEVAGCGRGSAVGRGMSKWRGQRACRDDGKGLSSERELQMAELAMANLVVA